MGTIVHSSCEHARDQSLFSGVHINSWSTWSTKSKLENVLLVTLVLCLPYVHQIHLKPVLPGFGHPDISQAKTSSKSPRHFVFLLLVRFVGCATYGGVAAAAAAISQRSMMLLSSLLRKNGNAVGSTLTGMSCYKRSQGKSRFPSLVYFMLSLSLSSASIFQTTYIFYALRAKLPERKRVDWSNRIEKTPWCWRCQKWGQHRGKLKAS